ncbi:protease inhibitor I42 family protein [Candidatus Bathyarchaeota archaeon]|nr:protease inhibitor I42 family protein [Candidatus Bathyarchaeota archaeon]
MSTKYKPPNFFIKTTRGKEFTIALDSIPSAGYTWDAQYDETILELAKPKETARLTDAIGGGVEELFTFRTKKKGSTETTMTYKRAWEKTPEKTMQFRIEVE